MKTLYRIRREEQHIKNEIQLDFGKTKTKSENRRHGTLRMDLLLNVVIKGLNPSSIDDALAFCM